MRDSMDTKQKNRYRVTYFLTEEGVATRSFSSYAEAKAKADELNEPLLKPRFDVRRVREK